MYKHNEKEDKYIYDGEPDWKDILALQEATEQWKKDHPNWTDEDAADYYAQQCLDYLRRK